MRIFLFESQQHSGGFFICVGLCLYDIVIKNIIFTFMET